MDWQVPAGESRPPEDRKEEKGPVSRTRPETGRAGGVSSDRGESSQCRLITRVLGRWTGVLTPRWLHENWSCRQGKLSPRVRLQFQ